MLCVYSSSLSKKKTAPMTSEGTCPSHEVFLSKKRNTPERTLSSHFGSRAVRSQRATQQSDGREGRCTRVVWSCELVDERFNSVLEPARSKGDGSARGEGAANDASLRADSGVSPGRAPRLEGSLQLKLRAFCHILFFILNTMHF